jgi:hypothetical protein
MGGLFSFLGSVWSSLGGLGQAAIKTAAMLALDIGSALLGGSTAHGEKLKNKTIASSTYGHPLPRARGTVRLNGQLIFWTGIQETTHKLSSGGIFGIGQHSVYTYTYSTSCAFAFGKKLGGGQAVKFIRIWADGKLLYSALTTDASLTGTATIVGTVAGGTQAVPVSMSGGGSDSLTLSAGDIIHFSSEPNTDYEVQQGLTIGSGASGLVDVYPPLDTDMTGDTISIPGLTAPMTDLSSFDPNPHDGSHLTGNPVPSGSIRFHYGTATEEPDPRMLKQFGAGQAAAYRGLPYVMLDYLQLANYGNHLPSITAEIAFDVASDKNPKVGPISGVSLLPGGGGAMQFLVPAPQASAYRFSNPNLILPYMWAMTGTAPSMTVYKIDTRTNRLVSSVALSTGGGIISDIVVDADGFIYFTSGSPDLFKFDGQAMEPTISVSIGIISSVQVWDMQASAFGNPVLMKLLGTVGAFGSLTLWDRKAMVPLGTLNAGSGTTVVLFWETNGSAVTGPGDPIVASTPFLSLGLGSAGNFITDAKGNIWLATNDGNLTRYDGQPQSGVYINPLNPLSVPVPVMYPPSLDATVVDVSAIAPAAAKIFYSAADNSIIVLGGNGLCRVSCDTFAITATNTSSHPWSGGAVHECSYTTDQLGTFLVTGSSTVTIWRYDAASLALLNTYSISSWIASPSSTGEPFYDGILNTLWFNQGGSLYRLYLDRGAGGGIGLDSIVASIFSEAGYDSSEYDVTALTGISTGGYEIDQEPYLDSIKKLQQLFLFDMTEIDGVIVCVQRSAGAGVLSIPEDDLGATEIGTAPAARLAETLQQETDVPQTVWVQYYDETKELQQATQYDKRITSPYATALLGNPKVTNSKNQMNLSVPVTDSPAPMKQQARSILLDAWQARFRQQFKTGPKYMRLDPTDKIQITYKGLTLDVRLTAVDLGAGLAMEFQGESYDSGVYSVPAVVTQPGGTTPVVLPPTPPTNPARDNYTVTPSYPLTQTSTTNLALAATTAQFDSGLRTQYNARPTLAIADPGSGLTQIYYVTIYDPEFLGEVPGTNSLTVFVETTPGAAHVGETGYINMGSIVAAGSGATGGNGGTSGQPAPASGVLVAEIAFGPTTRGNFTVAHNLAALGVGPVPADVHIQVTVAAGGEMGSVEFQTLRYDAQNIYLIASEDNISGFLEIYA